MNAEFMRKQNINYMLTYRHDGEKVGFTMEITVFAKKRTTKDNTRTFYSYLSKLTRKDGTEQTVTVKFRDECGAPKPDACPMNIIIEKDKCNMSKKDFIYDETGEVGTSHTLWVTAWEQGAEYVDHSMDEFM